MVHVIGGEEAGLVLVPSNANDGTTVVRVGRGERGVYGGATGNLVVRLVVTPTELVSQRTVQGQDLPVNATLVLQEASEISLPSIAEVRKQLVLTLTNIVHLKTQRQQLVLKLSRVIKQLPDVLMNIAWQKSYE